MGSRLYAEGQLAPRAVLGRITAQGLERRPLAGRHEAGQGAPHDPCYRRTHDVGERRLP